MFVGPNGKLSRKRLPFLYTTRRAITAADTVVIADNGNMVDCTANTFTLTITSGLTLGAGFRCYIRNSGTGDITLQPQSGTIDGLSNWILYPGGTILLQCDGTNLYSTLLTSMKKMFTSNGTWTKPGVGTCAYVQMWGGGGGGGLRVAAATANAGAGGGGGGGYNDFTISMTAFSSTESITVASGGSGGSGAASASGSAGGNTSFKGRTAYGGGSGSFGGSNQGGAPGGGGGDAGAGGNGISGGAAGAAGAGTLYPGGQNISVVMIGGGEGGACSAGGGTLGNPTSTYFGGAGGACAGQSPLAGGSVATSVVGGNGGSAGVSTNGGNGATPGGGGGAAVIASGTISAGTGGGGAIYITVMP